MTMKNSLLMFAVLMLFGQPAHAYFEDHPVQDWLLTPILHPKKAWKATANVMRHPTETTQKIGAKCQAVGVWYETKPGVKGCGNIILTGTGIGTNVLLGAKSFR